MSKQNKDHIVIRAGSNQFECKHCGTTYNPNLPMPIDMFCAIVDVFVKNHTGCKMKEKS
jgi:rubredoxin